MFCSKSFFSSVQEPAMTKSVQEIKSDVAQVIDHAEDLLKQAAASSGEQAAELQRRGMKLLRQAVEKAQDLQDAVVERSKAAAQATDDYVHDHPWRAIGLAAAIGLAIGLLINRGR
jgi:ElaB/YqjD/DUF883 family membrane-anchored ribosome-binding protein